MSDFTFLTEDQITGKSRLDIIKKYGKKGILTDFSSLLGGQTFRSENFEYRKDEYRRKKMYKKKRISNWWTLPKGDSRKLMVSQFCRVEKSHYGDRNIGSRPAIPYSSIKERSIPITRSITRFKKVLYGEYPQTIVDSYFSEELEQAYNNKSLKTTGKKYTTDAIGVLNNETLPFKAGTHIEYKYKDKKYIRFIADINSNLAILSDGRLVQTEEAYWVQVEPIAWLVDEKSDIALAEKILFAGIPFNNDQPYDGNFRKTEIKKFMDNYFAKEIIPDRTYEKLSPKKKENIRKETIKKENPYEFNFKEVSEEDIIRGAVESNIPVFLHGESGDGKSARVKELDPDCEIIYMRNVTPDSLNGKSVYNQETGEMLDIPPTWYQKVLEKCEKEPDKLHIIFFDELTNALPSIQGMAFNIVLDKEVNGKWKLPKSLAANQMAEPLFNRFAHVYIETTVDSWLKWATTPKENYKRLNYKEEKQQLKIHPAIYSYIAYKSYEGEEVLRTPYNGEKPNADPRKWEMASKILYETKQPEMLRSLIGEELTREFTAFIKSQVISVKDVINHNYSAIDLEMTTAERFTTAVSLSSVDEEHFNVVRNFMKQVGPEPKAIFESMWVHGDEKRIEHLTKIKRIEANNPLAKNTSKQLKKLN